MHNIFCSADMTAFATTRRADGWFVGEVRLVFGRKALRVVHECLPLRDSIVEAELDARKDAKRLVEMWDDQVSL